MEDRIVKFISALRAGGVRVSLSESTDAFNAIQEMGVRDREAFRLSLRTTLVKESRDLPVFEELFPLFFDAAEPPPLMDATKELTPDESKKLAEALRQFSGEIRKMLERLLRGDQLTQQELDQLNRLVGLERATDLRYRDWMARRMEQALRFPEVKEAMKELADLLEQLGMNKQRVDQIQQLMQANQQALQDQLRQYSGQRIAENMSRKSPEKSADGLLNQPFSSLSDKDMQQLRKEVKRLAAALRTRIALRQKRAKNGQLDAKSTIRANLKHGSVPIEIRHRDRTLKPKIVVICDVSTSMRYCSELMLNLLHAMQDQISKTHAFAFIDHIEYITPDFQSSEVETAVGQVLDRMPSGYYNTDLGSSLLGFTKQYLDTVDSRTIFIMVGDARNNYNDPRQDLFNTIARRTRRTIWLNPEAPVLWGTGDSDMLKYASACDLIFQVGNLAELTAAVDKLLG
jgi:uncharacterized protein with von Willebrand factor type A (vWA) domain